MSVVTNVILTFPLMYDGEAETLLRGILFKQKDGREVRFELLPDAVTTGSKNLEANVCVAAFNYLDLAGLLDTLKTVKWEEPENVCVFVQEDTDDKFTERFQGVRT